jgi:hypothetical protein
LNTTDRRSFIQNSAAAIIAAMHGPQLLSSGTVHAETTDPTSSPLLQKLSLCSNDLDALEPFYRDVLELPVDRVSTNLMRVAVGPTTIEFSPDAKWENPFYHFAFTIPENLLEKSFDWLEPRCPILDVNPSGEKIMHFKNWNAHSIYFLDPVGNILEFIAHHDLNNGSSDPFGPDKILFTSEIGLVVPDVPAFVGEIETRFGETPFRGLSSRRFTAVGSMRGLVIVVEEGRTWFPQNIDKSDAFPTEVTLNHGKNVEAFNMENYPYIVR